MPGLVEIRLESKTAGVLNQPAVRLGLRLNQAVAIACAYRVAADVKIERPSGEMRAVDSQTCPPAARRLAAKLLLILAGAKRRDDFEIQFVRRQFSIAVRRQAAVRVRDGG